MTRAVLGILLLVTSCDYPVPFQADNPRDPLGEDFHPDPPSTVHASLINDGEVLVTWTSTSSPLSEAEVQRRMGNAEFVAVGTVPMEAGELRDRWEVPPYTPFQYRIIARHGDRSSDPALSEEVIFDFPSPYALAVREPADSAVALAWRYDGAGHQQFVVERSDGTGPFVAIGQVDAAARVYDDATVEPVLRYIYRVRAATDRYQSRSSNEVPVRHSYTLKVTDRFQEAFGYGILAADEAARTVLRTAGNGALQILDLDSEQELYQLPAIVGGMAGAALNREHDLLIMLGYEALYVHRLASGAALLELAPFSGSGSRYRTFALSPDGQMIAAAGGSEVEWLRVADGQVVKRYENLPGSAWSLAFSDDGALLAIGTHQPGGPYFNRVLIWDIATDQLVRSLEPKCSPQHVSLDRARRLLAVSSGWGCSDVAFEAAGGVSLWSLESGEEIPLGGLTENDQEGIVAFTYDGRALMRSDRYGLHWWDSGTGSYLRNDGLVKPFTSRGEDRVVFEGGGFVNVARSGPFWVQEYVPPQ